MKRVSARTVAVVVAVAAVMAFAVWAYGTSQQPRSMMGVVVASGKAVLEVSDQQLEPGAVLITRVVAPTDSWVVVTSATATGSAGVRVGMARVTAGETRDLRLVLDAGADPARDQVITLHADRGIVGRFEFDSRRLATSPDKPYLVDGVELSSSVLRDAVVSGLAVTSGSTPAAEISANPGTVALEVAQRLLVLDHMVVDRVRAPEPSWVVVYLVGKSGRPGAQVGIAAVPAGESAGVYVPIDPSAVLTRKLLVTLQADRGVVGTFEFDPASFNGSPDRPYAALGSEVSAVVELREFGAGSGDKDGSSGGM